MFNSLFFKGKFVFQIVDSPKRDLEWRLYLSLLLSKAGITSFIGLPNEIKLVAGISKNALLLGRFGGNSGRSIFDVNLIKILKKNNIDMYFLHDEGAFYFESEYETAVQRVYPEDYFNENFFKKVYFWGEKQLEYFTDKKYSAELKVLGCPRFDLFKSNLAFIDEKLNKDDFVLICSRFAGLAPIKGDVSYISKRMLEIRKEGLKNSNSTDVDVMSKMIETWKNVSIDQAVFLDAMFTLCAKHPDVNILFRPHPGEDPKVYNEVFSVLDNVKISKTGDLRPLVREATMMIHSESTSGVEAEIANTPTINFVNNLLQDKMSIAGANLVGISVNNTHELLNEFEKILNNKTIKAPDIEKEITKYVKNYSSDYSAMDTLVEDILLYFKDKSTEEILLHRKFNVFTSEISRYWLSRAYRYISNIITLNKREVKNKSIVNKKSKKELLASWERMGGSLKQLEFSSGMVIVKPIKNTKS